MPFTILHILIAFCLGFILGSIFGMGVHKLRQGQTHRKKIPPPTKHVTITQESIPPLETLDIPRINRKSVKTIDQQSQEKNLSFGAFAPAVISIESTEISVSDLNDEQQPPNDDATVLMHRPPPE